MKITRRRLLSTATLASAGLVLPVRQIIAAPFPPRPRPIKIATKYGMIAGGKSVLEKFQIAAEAGFEGVEPNGPLDEKTLEEMGEAIQKTGIVVPGIVCPKGGRAMGLSDEAGRTAGVEEMKTCLRQSKQLGGTTVLMYPGTVDKEHQYHVVYANLLKSTREAEPTARELGMKIALENVWNNIFISPLDAVTFVDTINSPHVGWFFDIGNIARYGWPEHWVHALGKRIFKLDIKDYSTALHMEKGPRAGFGPDIGDGDIDFAAVMKALDEVGYSGGWISAEVKGGDLTRLKDVAARVDRVLRL